MKVGAMSSGDRIAPHPIDAIPVLLAVDHEGTKNKGRYIVDNVGIHDLTPCQIAYTVVAVDSPEAACRCPSFWGAYDREPAYHSGY